MRLRRIRARGCSVRGAGARVGGRRERATTCGRLRWDRDCADTNPGAALASRASRRANAYGRTTRSCAEYYEVSWLTAVRAGVHSRPETTRAPASELVSECGPTVRAAISRAPSRSDAS